MSAAEVIEMIKRLPPAEREEVRAFVREGGDTPKLRHIPKEEYAKLAPKIFEENRELLRRLAQ
jgi:hypothetical protein